MLCIINNVRWHDVQANKNVSAPCSTPSSIREFPEPGMPRYSCRYSCHSCNSSNVILPRILKNIHPFTPFCFEWLVQYNFTSADSMALLCKSSRAMFKIFCGKNCRIFQIAKMLSPVICVRTVKQTCETIHGLVDPLFVTSWHMWNRYKLHRGKSSCHGTRNGPMEV